MSRTTLCVLTAFGLALVSGLAMAGRYLALGGAVQTPTGPDAWRVRLVVHGQMSDSEARLLTATPVELGRVHFLHQSFRSDELAARQPDPRRASGRLVLWTQRPGASRGPFKVTYQFACSIPAAGSTTHPSSLARTLYAPPVADQDLQSEQRIESQDSAITDLARSVVCDLHNPADQFDVLYRHVAEEIAVEPTTRGLGLSAIECLHAGGGDALARSRLLVALCRNRGIPARLVTGLTLRQGHEQLPHVWMEAWINKHWVPACSVHHRLGRLPASYIAFAYGDVALVRGRHLEDLDYVFLVEKATPEPAAQPPSGLRLWLQRSSLYALPPAERHLTEFLLLLPVAALVVCIYRNLIGLGSFGTFAPALIGLAFRDLASAPGIILFVSIILLGWLLRKVLDHYHLLQVPRMAFLLSLVVIVLIGFIVASNMQGWAPTKYISLFPMIILTGMIERFWTLESEDGTGASFRTLLATLLIAATISLVASIHALVHHLLGYPETLGVIMACQLLLGRYTGYRLLELIRFRDLIANKA